MAEELLRHLYIPSATDSRYSLLQQNTPSGTNSSSQNISASSNDSLRDVHISQNPSSLSPYALVGLAATDPREVTRLKHTMADDVQDHILSQDDSYYSANSSPAVRPAEPSQQAPIDRPLHSHLVDLDSYLHQNAHHLAEKSTKGKRTFTGVEQGLERTSTGSNAQNPVTDAPKGVTRSAASTGIFAQTCQLHGIQPVWDIKEAPLKVSGAPRFIGSVTFGDQTVTVNEVQLSKKDVRTLLAERALPILETFAAPAKKVKLSGDGDGEEINWVGKLYEWNSSLPINLRMLDYTEYPPLGSDLRFGATVSIAIPASPDPVTKTFGFPQDRYKNKKTARTAASKAAVEYLIRIGQLATDGSVIKKPKGNPEHFPAPTLRPSRGQPAQALPVVAAASRAAAPMVATPTAAASTEAPTFSSRVPAMSHKLGFPPPAYDVTPTNPEISGSAFFDCTATFPPSTGLQRPAAAVSNVYGKKNAKEDCAREVCALLEAIMEKRLREAGLLPTKGGEKGQPTGIQNQQKGISYGLDGNVDTEMGDG